VPAFERIEQNCRVARSLHARGVRPGRGAVLRTGAHHLQAFVGAVEVGLLVSELVVGRHDGATIC
jgi:hypothetical protein